MIRAVAIDDEPKALSIIRNHASKTTVIELVKTFNNPFEALNFLNANEVDLIFLDINMPKLSGFDLLGKLDRQPLVVITSAYAEYGVKSYAFEVVDYLLKPFELEQFTGALDKVVGRLTQSNGHKSILLRDGYEQVVIQTAEINYVKSDGNYLDVFLETKKLSPRMTFSDLLNLLPEAHFVRVHNSYVVNLSKVEKLQTGSLQLGGQIIPVSNSYKSFFETKIKS
ncbi:MULTISPECIES: LytTR family DNA-binding domain-containing protein [unclassified Leeuwenhoekiella]|uniref:LytR/AlgR family response regulator transcription factor n=1 Tax=unclassified Leeuwenhoekiella TaxID=2615029 RepID=UPI000C5AF8AD|nr:MULTISPECIES: LytTR family DNA-binding domain-containing protein [unclassified Leeuwenhoekiella]MAW94432.1 DNA-binding response regulator [Leeuwenhoekiella sp.]MBA81109.1 DNA-binding response regulator [Leeuwenhoekiella sp.]|tara:strand:- start:1936 stop:2610 length:675 start_codon:yes stop_codon:yes gene_type:complete